MRAPKSRVMGLSIQTFSNKQGGNALFKALGHPLAAGPAAELVERLSAGPVAVYDPLGQFEPFAQFYDVFGWDLRALYVQDFEDLERAPLGHAARPITDIGGDPPPRHLLVAAFDSERLIDHIRHLVPAGVDIASLDALRIPDAMLTRPRRYLDPLNFATNFGLLREADGHHTRITLCNYWSGYGAEAPRLWLRLFDDQGRVLADWEQQPAAAGATVSIDSRQVRERFGLGEFTGSLFIHAVGVAGHDVVKYALDTYGDADSVLSCTHDANAWPADFYAGLPAPAADESVRLWIQNSHPLAVPAGGIGLSLMGSDEVRTLEASIPPYGTYALEVASLYPEARWPAQLQVHAGKYFVRPRYEITSGASGRSRIAHANVERTDLQPDPNLPRLGEWLGKGYLLPAPILPTGQWSTEVLPTPMATCQQDLPIALVCYDASGEPAARLSLGRVPRDDCPAVGIDDLLAQSGAQLPSGYGHLEVQYDFERGGEADGWLHALFRYRQRASGHAAESSFGAHVYNLPLTYRGEPQSYAGRPPGLSTRLFLRLGPAAGDTLCHLIYPASGEWHSASRTSLILHDANGGAIATRGVSIPRSGSLLWRYNETFQDDERRRAGEGAYVLIRDTTCRLFGYHGLLHGEQAFSLDHMFGF